MLNHWKSFRHCPSSFEFSICRTSKDSVRNMLILFLLHMYFTSLPIVKHKVTYPNLFWLDLVTPHSSWYRGKIWGGYNNPRYPIWYQMQWSTVAMTPPPHKDQLMAIGGCNLTDRWRHASTHDYPLQPYVNSCYLAGTEHANIQAS